MSSLNKIKLSSICQFIETTPSNKFQIHSFYITMFFTVGQVQSERSLVNVPVEVDGDGTRIEINFAKRPSTLAQES